MLAVRQKNLLRIAQFARRQQSACRFASAARGADQTDGTSQDDLPGDLPGDNPALEGFRAGALQPRVVEFQFSVDQAKEAFRHWHSQRWLAPTKLLEVPGSSIRPVLLPFWLFEVSVHVQHSARLGFLPEGKPDGPIHWSESGTYSRHREYPWNLASMQIYASYKWRRDFVDGIKSAGSLTRTRPLKLGEAATLSASAGKGQDSVVDLDPPTMRQSVAWELALRTIRMKEVAAAEETLKATSNADLVQDIKISVRANRRRARILYLPAYIVDYTYGEYLTSAGERKPHKYMAVVSGFGECQVMGERHFNSRKAQALTGAVVGGSTLAVGALSTLAFEGASLAALLSIENAFWLFMACTSAGLAAKLAPYVMQRRLDEARMAADEADLDKLHKAGLGPLDVGDEESLWTGSNREWRRWEESDLWRWDERKRRRWATNISRDSHSRALQHRRAIERQTRQQDQLQAETDREARRRERFGDTSSHFQRMGGEAPTYGGHRAARWDAQGFYKLLGLPTERGSDSGALVSDRDVKRAFRRAAMRWHPDRRDSLPPSDRPLAHERFTALSKAYEVLRDPDLRRQYDSGQSVVV